ncbi:hypothetical protein DVH24_011088 [Malus domestica]|uniref:Uncharacterized protein n=1 Tax=Malus domestica TaxID=3750 RepID=A0A498JXS0_MALDO|nr:hypothetical protein DVH24_011088 [Malus domestica]
MNPEQDRAKARASPVSGALCGPSTVIRDPVFRVSDVSLQPAKASVFKLSHQRSPPSLLHQTRRWRPTLSNQEVRLLVLLGDVGAGKSSLVLSFVKEQFVEFQFLLLLSLLQSSHSFFEF